MPTRDVAVSDDWRFAFEGEDIEPGRYMARHPITEAELRRVLRVIFHVSVLPDNLMCWPVGNVDYAD